MQKSTTVRIMVLRLAIPRLPQVIATDIPALIP